MGPKDVSATAPAREGQWAVQSRQRRRSFHVVDDVALRWTVRFVGPRVVDDAVTW